MFQAQTRNHLASALVVGLLFLQLLALGAVGGAASAAFALAEIGVCLVLVFLLSDGLADRFWAEIGPVFLLFLAALAWAATPMVLAAFPHAPHPPMLAPDAARLELLKLAGLGAVCVAGGLIGVSRARLQLFIVDISVFGLAYTLVGLWVGQVSPWSVWGQPKGAHAFRFTGTLLNANAAGCVFGMLGLVSLGLLQSLLKRIDLRTAPLLGYLWLALVTCAVAAAFGACVLTQSRAALALVGVLGAGVVALEARRSARREEGVLASRLMLGATAAIVIVSLAFGAGQFSSRWSSLLIDAQVRGQAYAHYFGAMGASPWFGYGLGGFRALHERILTPDLAPALWDFGAAHSALSQAVLEGGWPFALLILATVGLIGARIVGLGGRKGRPARRGAILTGVMAATAQAVLFSFVDIALNVPSIAALAVALFGVAWGDAVGRGTPSPVRLTSNDIPQSNDRISSRDWTPA